MARRKKDKAEINASSMADIAFLLLIFFLVTTTIDTDKGIAIKLPPMADPDEPPPEIKLKERNVFKVLVNAGDMILCNGEVIDIKQLKKEAENFIDNANRQKRIDWSSSPQKAIISLKNDRGTSYEMYIAVQNELKRAYGELRNTRAMALHGDSYDNLLKRADRGEAWADEKSKEIRAYYKQVISEAEPEDIGRQEG